MVLNANDKSSSSLDGSDAASTNQYRSSSKIDIRQDSSAPVSANRSRDSFRRYGTLIQRSLMSN